MTNATLTAAITAAILTTAAPTIAAGGITPLGDCYTHVISACNQGSHPVFCSKNGMDACDEEHSSNVSKPAFKAATGMTIKRLR